jgi:preprotein translocase subunit SecA
MGLFSSKPKLPDYSDKVWKNSEYAVKGMLTDALSYVVKDEIPVLTSFFKESHERLVSFLKEKSIPHFALQSTDVSEAFTKSKEVLLIEPSLVSNHFHEMVAQFATKAPCHLLFLGHYPLPDKENKLLERLNGIRPLSITFYSSLDNPLMDVFGANNIISLMEKLGMKEDEAIEHTMVTKAMQNARRKLEEMVKFEQTALSEKEWFEKNHRKSH